MLHRGVYAVGHRRLRPEGHRLAAVLACGPGAVLSHTSAAAHWGLLNSDQQRIDVTAHRGRRGAPGIRLHRTRSLDAQDTTSHRGIPTTTVSRTLLDLAAARPERLENALAQAMRQNLYDHRALESVVARSSGHRGSGALTKAIAHDPKWTRGAFEPRFLKLLRDAGLPEPLVNEALHVPDFGECQPDFHWPSQRLIVELDDWHSHRTRAAFERDRAKDAALTAIGYRVMRFTTRTDPETVLRRVEAVLSAGSRPRSG